MNSKLYKLRLMAAAAITLMMTMMVLTACTSDNDHNPTPKPTDGSALVGTWVGDLTGKTHTMWTYGKAWNVWTFNADGTGVCDVYFTSNDQPLALQHQPFTYTAEGGNMTVTMADKRQIENAVAGVSLYSVKSVTNTEVELTAELSVIAAEMPYFIYNDNDTEVEVSIVVSSSDADNVEYDSEHFKGTLVDKTFTDEDMEEADHYVLSGGHDFVWVKDAGTLAAGKCWIELVPSSEAHARRLVIVHEGTTTGINAVNAAATMDGNIYDLSGRRVMQPTRSAEGRLFPKGLKKGLYIVRSAEGRLQGKNGKKVVVK